MVYIAESDLEAVRVRYVKEGHAEVHAGHRQDLSAWWGSNGSGLILFGYSLRERSVDEFAVLMAAAEDALKTAPR